MIEARHISFEIHAKKLLDDVSVEVKAGEILAVLGQNGAGKSTLRKILCGDLTPTNGEVLMSNKPLHKWSLLERAKVRAVLPQDATLNFPFTVSEVVLLGRAPHIKVAESGKDFQIARETLEAVEAAHLANRLYPTLSGGERQRVQLARILAQIWEKSDSTRYLILDEPTSNLDIAHQHSTLKIARRLAKENVSVLVILHDLNLAVQYADRILLLKDGKIMAQGSSSEILNEETLEKTFNLPFVIVKHPFGDFPLICAKPD